jgi:thioester reductase-like protein
MLPVPVGECGELYIGGLGVAVGYLKLPQLNQQKFINYNGKKLYKTADRIRYWSEDEFEFLGRIDRQFKLMGLLVEPFEIESRLLAIEGVLQALAFKLCLENTKNQSPREILIACYQSNNLKEITLNEDKIRILLSKSLPKWMVPLYIFRIDEIPIDSHGKTDFNKLSLYAREIIFKNQSESNANITRELIKLSDQRVQENILEIFRRVSGWKDGELKTPMQDWGIDSLRLIQIVVLLEQKKIFIPTHRILSESTLENLLTFLHKASARSVNRSNESQISFLASKAELPLELISEIQAATVKENTNILNTPKSILLTGASGFLGIYILADLLKVAEHEIYCLLRTSNAEEGKSKLISGFAKYKLQVPKDFDARVIIIFGDISQPFLGLSRDKWTELTTKVDIVVHSAAKVNLVATYQELEATNVLGTKRIIDFIIEGKQKCLHFISTLSVFVGTDRVRGSICEEDNPDHCSEVYGGYAQTKWVADKMLRNAIKAGLSRVHIHRLGLVCPDTSNGVPSGQDMFSSTLWSILQTELVPETTALDLKMDVTPVDFAAAAIVALVNGIRAESSISHIANPQSLTFLDLIDFLRALNLNIKQVPIITWTEEIRSRHCNALDVRLASFLLSISSVSAELGDLQTLDLFQATGFEFLSPKTNQYLANMGITCPKVDLELIKTYLNALPTR